MLGAGYVQSTRLTRIVFCTTVYLRQTNRTKGEVFVRRFRKICIADRYQLCKRLGASTFGQIYLSTRYSDQ